MRVIGLDTDGCLICVEEDGVPFNCGETPAEFGAHNLLPDEFWVLAL